MIWPQRVECVPGPSQDWLVAVRVCVCVVGVCTRTFPRLASGCEGVGVCVLTMLPVKDGLSRIESR